jgi:peroxiredoxin
MLKCLISILIFFFAQVCHAQKKFTTVFRLPESIDTKIVRIYYDDGKTTYPVNATFFENKATITGTFYSKYVTLSILYPKTESTFHSNDFFVKEGRSSIVFTECRNGDSLANPFDSCKLTNAIEIRKLPDAKKLHLLTEREELQIKELYEEYFSKTGEKEQDSIMKIINDKSTIIKKEQMEFVKQNKDKYYSLWLFKRNFLSPYSIQKYYDTLLKLFASFPVGLRNSFEGVEILKTMNGVMNTKKGYKASLFTAKDISGAAINLKNYKGKYVLLTFWASWCGPCLQEMPAIKKIRDSYSTDKLKVISISIDSDSAAFVKAMTANKMNWTNILDRERDIYMRYGGKPIPSLYLINKEGIIVYCDSEDRFEVLTDLLSKSIQ